jgi:tRNA 2-thiocytidine biosynthesis protein TtcA
VRAAVTDWHLVEPGRLGVAISGGADSLALFRVLGAMSGDIGITLVPLYIDQYGGNRRTVLQEFFGDEFGIRLITASADTTAVAERAIEKGHGPCRVCAPIRARAIGALAERHGIARVALGHHLTDVYATLMMNMLHRGQFDTMRIVTRRRGQDPVIIRPLYFETEAVVKSNSMTEPGGLFDCGMCSIHASERKRVTQFVNESFALHVPAIKYAQNMLKQLNQQAGPLPAAPRP